MFLPKKKGDVFFSTRKAADERWGVVESATLFFGGNRYLRVSRRFEVELAARRPGTKKYVGRI